eukprot:gene616-1189_t
MTLCIFGYWDKYALELIQWILQGSRTDLLMSNTQSLSSWGKLKNIRVKLFEVITSLNNFADSTMRVVRLRTDEKQAMPLGRLQYCGLPDPKRYLQIFAGVPPSYRMSVLHELAKKKEHTMEAVVCPSNKHIAVSVTPPSIDFQFNVQIMKVTGARISLCRTTKVPTATEEGDFPQFLGNVLKIHATSHSDFQDKWKFTNAENMDPSVSCFVRTTIQSKEGSKTKTNANATASSMPGGTTANTNNISNTTVPIPAPVPAPTVAAAVASVSTVVTSLFTTNDPTKGVEKPAPLSDEDQLHLFVELISTMRVYTKEGLARKIRKAKTNAVDTKVERKKTPILSLFPSSSSASPDKDKKNTDKDKSRASRGKDRGRDRGDDDQSERDDDMPERRREGSNNNNTANNNVNEEDEEEDNPDDFYTEPLEMCVGWVMIPISTTLKRDMMAGPLRLPLSGGTPFSRVTMQAGDVRLRKGSWNMMKRLVGYGVKSVIEIQFTRASVNKDMLKYMPENVIIPTNAMNPVCMFRNKLCKAQEDVYKHTDNKTALPQSWALVSADAFLSAFPRILSDPAASRVLMQLFTKSSTNTPDSFRELVLRVWEAFCSPDAKPNRLRPVETIDAIYRREIVIRERVNLTQIPSSLLKTAQATQPTGEGGKTPAYASQELTYVPFNARELMWQSRNVLES